MSRGQECWESGRLLDLSLVIYIQQAFSEHPLCARCWGTVGKDHVPDQSANKLICD